MTEKATHLQTNTDPDLAAAPAHANENTAAAETPELAAPKKIEAPTIERSEEQIRLDAQPSHCCCAGFVSPGLQRARPPAHADV